MDNWLLGYKEYGISYEFVGYHFINGPLDDSLFVPPDDRK